MEEVIDAQWLSERLKRYGVQRRLAEFLQLSDTQISRMKSGQRQIQQAEAARIRAFFSADESAAPPKIQAPHGFSESDVAPMALDNRGTAQALCALLAPGVPGVVPYITRRNDPSLGLMPGDGLVVSSGATPEPGAIVVATVADTQTGEANTVVRRLAPPYLASGAPADPQPLMNMNAPFTSVAILGVVIALWRPAEPIIAT
jgi:hypothetical protein